MEETRMPINRQVDRKAVVHIHNRLLLGYEKLNVTFYNSMDGPRRCYAMWNKSDRVRRIPYHFTYK